MKDLEVYGVAAILLFFGILETIGGVYGKRSIRSRNDWLVEVVSFLQLVGIIKPLIFVVVAWLFGWLFPTQLGCFSDLSLWVAIPWVLLLDDVMQYWYHRSAHNWSWLWKLHRPHHAAREMGVLVSYRNANLFFLLMPNIYWLAIATQLGMVEAVALSIIAKQLVVTAAHSQTKWDQYLYRYKWLHPLAWIIERVISTPSTHFAHHGRSNKDGVSNPNGNFSNMFFLWDMLFGTAQITRSYPTEFGIEDDPDDPWYSHLLYPLVKSPKKESELAE